ncbi:Uncharacterised protein [Mycolicibacterium vanbaalenii]|uniref:Uncharacterized protein n=1 Tax=Mycolicibacterium vanbaalenii TaxID=110539 RepID=A0A5S9R5P4_MYCVN|nr:hypothetical protein [Mycolicibacterium vanbaalenii]CAA0129280.1 Uncharacterised protein [Mycolicibacterium vanbaalenii]
MTGDSYGEVYQAGIDAAMTEVCAAMRECDGTAEDLYLRARGRVARHERGRRAAIVAEAAR